MNISYDYYRIFYYVAKYKSFSAAANAMLNNQPNLTRSIKRLELELGCKLFVRKKNGVELTPEGQKLYDHVSIAFEHIIAGENEIAKDESLQSGLVSISASEIALHCALLPVLKDFHSLYPKVKIHVSNHSTPQAIDILRNGLSDLAIVTTPLGQIKSLDHRVIQEIHEIPVCSKSFQGLSSSRISWEQLGNLPIICLGKNTTSFAFYSTIFSEKGIAFDPDIEAATADQIIPLVKSNLGIGFVPVEFLEALGVEKDIKRLELDKPIPARQICLIKRTDANPNIATTELEKMILNHSHASV